MFYSTGGHTPRILGFLRGPTAIHFSYRAMLVAIVWQICFCLFLWANAQTSRDMLQCACVKQSAKGGISPFWGSANIPEKVSRDMRYRSDSSRVAKRVVFQKSGFGGCSPGTKTGTRAHSDVPLERNPERGYVHMFPRNENRNEGTFAKTTPNYETALLSPSE